MAKLSGQSLRSEFAGGLACVWALLGCAGQAQTLNLPATLNSGSYAAASTVTNCTGTVSQANCTSVTLAADAAVTLAATTQIVLGPGFTAVAGDASTSLMASIVPAPTLSAVTVSPASVASGGSATITVTLNSTAIYGAVTVALSSSNAAAFSPPASITVAAGQISGSATVIAGTVSASTPVTVTASYNGSSLQGSVTVLPPPTVLTSVVVSPTTAISTTSAAVTVTLSGPAPAGGASVSLSSNSPAFNPNNPPFITVQAGQMTATGPLVAAGTVSALTNVTIAGSYDGVNQTGTISVLPLPTISLVSVTPNSGSIGSQIFSVTVGDSLSLADLISVFLLVGPSATTTAGACYVRYDLATNGIFLADNFGNWQPGIAVGQSGFLENSQCLLRSDLSTAAPSGNNLAVGFDLSFKPSFNGSQSLYAGANDAFSNTGLLPEGTWTLSQPLSIASLPAIAGSGPGETFTTVFTDTSTNGAGNLASLSFWAGAASSPTATAQNSCKLTYTFATNLISLYSDDATTQYSLTPGVGAVNNSQCALTGAGASVTVSGNTATLVLPLSFSTAYDGPLNILAYAADATQNTGWYNLGTWTATAPAWPSLSVSSAHSGNFTLGQNGATYTLTVTNGVFATATDGSQVTVTEAVPSGMTLVSMAGGAGWSCANNSCTQRGVLAPGASYPPITVTVNVGANATGPQLNSASVSGGGSAASTATDSTTLADFAVSLAATSATTILAGGSATYCVTVGESPGFSGTVALAALGLPAGASAIFSAPNSSCSGASTMTVTMPASGAGTPDIAVSGTASGTLNHTSAGIPLNVQDFTIAVSPNSSPSSPLGVLGGQTVNFTISATGLNGFSGPITVILGLPNCSNCLSGGSTSAVIYPGNSVNLYFDIAASAQTNSYTYSVSGSSGGLSHVTAGALNIAAQDISVSLVQSPVNTASSPGSANFTVSVASVNNFAGNVAFSMPLPTGWLPVSIPQQTLTAGGSVQSQFTVTVPSGVSPGQYLFSVAVLGAPNLRSASVELAVGSSPGPSLSISSATATAFYQGQSGAQYSVTVSNQSGAASTSGAVTVTETPPTGLTLASMSGAAPWSCSGNTCSRSDSLPAGSSYSPIAVTVNVALNAPSIVYNQVSVSGGGSVAASASESTAIQGPSVGPGFTITASPTSQTVIPGGTAVYTISVAAQGSFAGAVSLGMGVIAGASAYLSSSTVAPGTSVTLTVNTFPTTLLSQNTPIPIAAIAGSITQTVTPTLTVQALTVSSSSPAQPTVLANATAVPTIYAFSNGNGTWLNPGSCTTTDPNVTATVSTQTSTTATIIYTADIAATSSFVAATCSYTCPGGNGPITLPPVKVSPAPVIFTVTDLQENPNPVVYAGVPTTLLIQGNYFGTTQGSIGFCPAGMSPCFVPQNLCNPGCGTSYPLPGQWTLTTIEVVLTLPTDATTGEWNLFVNSNAWISGAAEANPSRGVFHVSPAPPTVTVTPMDISGNPGDVFIFTATGVAPPGASGALQFQWSITEDETYPGTFNFVSSACTSGASCTTVSPPACTGSLTCTAYVQGTSPGFANLGVVFQVNSVSSQPQTPRMRQVTVIITKIWSDQFPGGPVANYLPGDGTQSNPAGDGAGAGMIGNARQLLIMGASTSFLTQDVPVSIGYLQANIVTLPNAPEALSRVFALLQAGQPSGQSPYARPSPNTNPPVGAWSSNGSTFSLSVVPLLAPILSPAGSSGWVGNDYSVVAGIVPQPGAAPTSQQISYTFTLDCPVEPQNGPVCSNGAVRIAPQLQYNVYSNLGPSGGGLVSSLEGLPTGLNFLNAFVVPQPPGGASIGAPRPNYPNYIGASALYFNNGLVFTGPTVGPINNYAFPQDSELAYHIENGPDFQQLLNDTLLGHNAEVLNYFNDPSKSGTNSYVFPTWQLMGNCHSVPNPTAQNCSSFYSTNPAAMVDQPPLFPCFTTPTTECDLRFRSDPDLFSAFGRVGYNVQLAVTVSRSSTNQAQFVVSNVALSGYIYDFYQWDPAAGVFDSMLSIIQAGYNTLGSGGQIYGTTVALLSSGPYTWTFQ